MIGRILPWLSRRRPWPRSLRGRLILLLLAALVAAQTIALILFFDERRNAVRRALAEQAAARTVSMTLLLERLEPELHEGAVAAASSRRARFSIADAPFETWKLRRQDAMRLREHLLGTFSEATGENWGKRIRIGRPPRPEHGANDGRRDQEGWRARRRGPPPALIISVELSSGRWLNVETRFRAAPLRWAWASLVAMMLAATAIVVIIWLSIGRLTRPLQELATAAERFGRGAREEPVPERGPLEARRLIATFNAMQERLSRFVADRTRLLASISHDLRTPLTAMRIRAELVENDETRAKLIEGLDEMKHMVEATLAFAKEDAAEEPMRAVDLSALVESVVEDFTDLGADVQMAEMERLVIECRPEALKRALRNLIDNGVRYGERAFVSLQPRLDMVAIIIEDDGPGVPTEKVEGLFEPFTRLEESRNRETGGTGLGLPIARSIARAHGGDATLSNRRDGGLRAEFTLPRSVGS